MTSTTNIAGPGLRRALIPLTAALVLIALTGCMHFPVHLTAATSHLEGPGSYEVVGPVEGKACQFNLFYLIPLGGNQLWKAKKNAIADGDGLIDVSVDSSVGWAIIGSVACTTVRGQRYRLIEVAGAQPSDDETATPGGE